MTAYEQREHDRMIRRRVMANDPATRGLTERERFLLGHISMFGSAGYPVRKMGSRWVCEPFPTVYHTKREAVAAFEQYYDLLLDLSGVEAYRREITERG